MDRISFALHKDTKILVDIQNVASGLDCNCICPSCKYPLTAKKGNINRWHFAHRAGGTYDDVCIYTPERAARAMLLQLLPSLLVIRTPSYTHQTMGTLITDSKLVDISNVETDDSVTQGNHAKIHIGKYSFFIYIALSGLDGPEIMPDDVSVLIFNMSIFVDELNKTNKIDATELLKHMIRSHHPAKRWIFHVNEKAVKMYPQRPVAKNTMKHQGDGHHKIQIENPNQLISSPRHYICIPCNHSYGGREPGLNPCPKCKNHLYRKLLPS